ncbi:hypothetical protein [Jannaschia rubra]|uniref:Uncharacterized protein n=1 Tax=Jannaschia rubra TaxID=282197 RepID=A0A0M6XR65_9RHOB|nr:hypothetical protein [Jannaschia rubra]CTQ33117.1 hypothetical protein JAN5088_01897 [Jannaschia rubra]SFG73680.1 hypothetical protein SAMN04488517_1133 [Jannaschia rubra]
MAQTQDIEDVLSSIRRLVANDGPTTRGTADGPALVLESQNRVIESEDPFQAIPTLAQQERDDLDAEYLSGSVPDDMPDFSDILRDLPDEILDEPFDDLSTDAVTDTEAASDGPDGTVIWAEDELRDVGADAPLDFTASREPEKDDFAAADFAAVYAEDADYEEMATDAPTSPSADVEPEEVDLSDLATVDLLDQDALRDMIAEIVRQELSGELGERITRNVRKLVRREIRLMLASDEFD